MYFPQLKRWRKALNVTNDEAMKVNPALAGVKELIAQMADSLPIAYISSVDNEGYPCTKAMLAPRKREGITTFYFTTNTFSLRVAHYKANPKASIYFCDAMGFKGMMLRGTMEVLTDAKSNRDYLELTKQAANECKSTFLDDHMVIGTSAMIQTEIDCIVNQYTDQFCNPMVMWGKYRKGMFKTTLPVSFQFHHVQMDGGHAAKFLQRLQDEIRALN